MDRTVRMKDPALKVKIAGMEFENPLLLASGIADETGASMAEAVRHGAGGVVTKSLSLEPREGHPNPCIIELPFGMINAMGLPNPGIEDYAEEVRVFREKAGSTPLVASVFGSTLEEYAAAAGMVGDIGADAVEINGSCPNAQGLGLQFGQDPEVIYDLVKEVKRRVKQPVFFKLTPATSDIVKLAEAAQEAGADGLVAINTMPAMKIDVMTRMPVLTNRTGGLSGPSLRPVGVRCVFEIASSPGIRVPIIAVGGILNSEDVLEYMMAGASAVQIGTAVTWGNLDVFSRTASQLEGFIEKEGLSGIGDIVGSALGVEK